MSLKGPRLIGVITNLNSRQNRQGKYNRTRLLNIVGRAGLVRETREFEELPEVVEAFRKKGVDVIAINGGDGTYGTVITELINQYGGDERPPVFLLRGGTINVLASAIGVSRGDPASLLARFTRDLYERKRLWSSSTIGSVKVTNPELSAPSYGFVFANGLVYNFVKSYYNYGDPNWIRALRVTLRDILLAPLPISWLNETWSPLEAETVIDGERWPYRDVMVSTAAAIEKLALWFKPFTKKPDHRSGFAFLLNSMSRTEIYRKWWKLSRARFSHERHFNRLAQKVVFKTSAGYLLDGDLWRPSGEINLTVENGPPIEVLTPGGE